VAEIKWTKRALQDLEEIAEYIANDSPFCAEVTVQKLFAKPSVLKKFPQIGRVVPEFEIENVRELISGNYRIIYRIVSERRIDILSVFHSARLLTHLPQSEES